MKDGTCPKCGSTDIRVKRDGLASYGAVYLPIGMFGQARMDVYVCMNCGYVESYVSDSYNLRRIAEKWPRLGD
jgi:predicted nucleic-acid-binding Zn-ribbon protein